MSAGAAARAAVDGALARLPDRHPTLCRAVLALSGGVDSTALALRATARLRPRWRLSAIHVHHGLQAEADRWADQVADLCRSLDLPLEVARATVRRTGAGIEADARAARQAIFERCCDDAGAVLLAHHRDDQVETFLMHAARGSGPRGLGAMAPARRLGAGLLLRPFLGLPRAALERVVEDAGLSPAVDPMNSDPARERTFLRERLLAPWRARRQGLDRALARAARLCAEEQEALAWFAGRALAERLGHEGESLHLEGFEALPAPVRAAIVRTWLEAARVRPPGEARLRELLRQCEALRDGAVGWEHVLLRRFDGRLWLDGALAPPVTDWSTCWDGGEVLELPGAAGCLRWRPVAPDQSAGAPPPVAVTFRRGGERLAPAPGHRQRPLKALLQERRIAPWVRQRLPLVVHDGALAAVPGVVESEPWRRLLAERRLRLAHEPATLEMRLTLALARRYRTALPDPPDE